MAQLLALLAQATDKPATPEGGGSFFNSIMFPMLIVLILWMVLMVFLPERKRRKEQQAMMGALKKNDKVYIAGGIVGTISNIHDNDEITIRLEEGKMRVLKSSILRVVTETPAGQTGQAETGIKTVNAATAPTHQEP